MTKKAVKILDDLLALPKEELIKRIDEHKETGLGKLVMPELIKADLGPYASRLLKYDLFNDEEYRLDSKKGLKFLHFNSPYNQRTFSKRMFSVWQNRTVAVLALSPKGIKDLAEAFLKSDPKEDESNFIRLGIGVAFVSRDDNYNKRIGRDESIKNMVEANIEAVSINVNKTHIYVSLATYKGVDLTLRLNKKTGFSTVVGQINGTKAAE